MRFLPLLAAGAVTLASVAVVGATTTAAQAAPAATAYALSGSTLLSFDTAAPSAVSSTAITGVGAGETLVGLDARPQNGQLYTLGVNATTDTATLYVVHEQTGFAVAIGTVGAIAFTADGATTVDLPDPSAVGYDIDVNPTADRVRVVAGALSFRVNPSTGAPVDGDNGGAPGSVTGTNADGPVHGDTSSVNGAAYTNNLANSPITTLYTLDSTSKQLSIQKPPNDGTQVSVHGLTLGGGALDYAVRGFDIAPGVQAATTNAAVASGSGYAVLTVAGVTSLYAVDLATGAVTVLGPVGTGSLPVQGLALQRSIDDGYPAIGLSSDGGQLVRFSTAAPGVSASAALTGVGAGETMVAVAWRPQTGQLYGLGVDATVNTGSLYRIDPQTGAASPVSAGQARWVQSDGITTVDLPDPAATGYGLDVSPATDRVRVTAGSVLNARLNPNTGLPVDGNPSFVGTNPDGGPSSELVSLAYTNAFGGDVSGSRPTTLYALDPSTNRLVVVNPADSGSVTAPLGITSAGAALDFTALAGLDVPEAVTVATSGAPAAGSAYAALTIGGQPGLYALDLASGRATTLGALPTTLRGLTLGQAGARRPDATPLPLPPAVARATLTKAGKAKQRKRTVDTGRALVCPATFGSSSCSSTIKVTASYQVKHHGKTKRRTAVLATRSVTTPRGSTTRLKVTLAKKGVKLLKQRGKLAAKVAITAPTGPAAAKQTTVVRLKLSRKRL